MKYLKVSFTKIMVRKGKLRAAKWTHDCSHFIFTSLIAKKLEKLIKCK